MNTKLITLVLSVVLAIGMHGGQLSHGADHSFLVVGDRGQLLSVTTSENNSQVTPIELPSLGHRLIDTYFESSEKKLFVTTDDAKFYKLDLSKKLDGYQRIQTTNDTPFSVWYDRRENRPAWLHLDDKKSAKKIRFRGIDNKIRTSRSADIEFSKGFVFGMHIDGWKTSGALATMNSQLTFLSSEYPDAQWIIVGRSQRVAVYGQKIANHPEISEPFKATYLFNDRARSRWHIQEFEERCNVTVFRDVAVAQGIYDIKGDKDPVTGNQIQGKPSGNWYFYVAKKNSVASYAFDPSWIVQYATANEAVISGGNKILILSLGDSGWEKPEPLAELPTGFSVFAIYPF